MDHDNSLPSANKPISYRSSSTAPEERGTRMPLYVQMKAIQNILYKNAEINKYYVNNIYHFLC